MASGDRERELQRQLTQAGLQAEALLEGSQAAAAAESEDMVKGLIQQRDTANDALVVGYCHKTYIALMQTPDSGININEQAGCLIGGDRPTKQA